MADSGPIAPVPPPWNVKCTTYMIPWWTSSATAENLPSKVYSPLEGASSFASKEFGIPKGGLSMIQLLRYTETPVGPYDEFIVAPGSFEYPVDEGNDGKKAVASAMRITRIYVSQKQTCWNGRANWNIPKHLARFEWTDNPDGSCNVKVFPYDTEVPLDTSEAKPSNKPFFQCTIQPMRYLPSFPMSISWFKYLGVSTTLVQPPLPKGSGAHGELPGTEHWAMLKDYNQYSSQSSLAWADMSQTDEDGNTLDEHDNFFPGLRRWNLTVKMADTSGYFSLPMTWTTPRWLS